MGRVVLPNSVGETTSTKHNTAVWTNYGLWKSSSRHNTYYDSTVVRWMDICVQIFNRPRPRLHIVVCRRPTPSSIVSAFHVVQPDPTFSSRGKGCLRARAPVIFKLKSNNISAILAWSMLDATELGSRLRSGRCGCPRRHLRVA